MNKKSKKRKKQEKEIKKIFLLLLILFTGVFLASSTYAWFTVNRIVYVDSLNVRVEAQGGIEISADAKTFKSYVSSEDLIQAPTTYKTSINQLPVKLEPVSTAGGLENGKLMLYYGSVTNNINGDYVLNASREIESSNNADGMFIAFDIFLKSNKDTKLYLTPESGARYVGDKLPGIENATRIAFVVLGNTVSNANPDFVQNLNNATLNDVYIWEPNYDVHNEYGIKHAQDVYGITVGKENNQPVSYDGIASEVKNVYVNQANQVNYPNLFRKVNVSYLTPANFINNKEIFSINSGITKIRLYAWLEGQDVDCENNSAVGNLDFKFQFSTNPS